jgi:hypothetical protein
MTSSARERVGRSGEQITSFKETSMSLHGEPQWKMPEPAMMKLVRDEEPTAGQEASADAGDAGSETSSMEFRFERRAHRRFDLEHSNAAIERWDGRRDSRLVFGRILDLSAGGIRLRTRQTGIRVDSQIRVRLELPNNGGIHPFVDTSTGEPRPSGEWVGWLAVSRVKQVGEAVEVAGRLVDMEELDRGMLGLYLSTQPLAA